MIQVPICSSVQIHCIKCGCTIEHCNNHADSAVNVGVWNGATVGTAFSGYKSTLNGCAFIIGICDPCLKLAVDVKHAVKFYDSVKAVDLPDKPHKYIEVELEFQPEE
jgi:hypothetical protein